MKDFLKNVQLRTRSGIPRGLRFIAPIFLGAALIGIVTSTLWFGGKRESLAAYAESALLRQAIRFASKPAASNSPVVVVSVNDSDLYSLSRAPHQLLKDAHIDEYANLVERVASYSPKLIVVSWLGNAQPLTAEYLRPLTDTIDRLGIADHTILAVHFYSAGAVPEEISRKYQVAEARDCYYEINSFCTWNPSWTWMPQRIADLFWNSKRPWTISTNLPHTLPNFVLNLPDLNTIPTYSFLDFRPPVAAEIPPNAAVFIGNNVTQDLQFRSNKDLLQKTFVASLDETRSLLTDGVPFHLFWAGLAEMFIEDSTVAVAPEWLCNVALIIMCIAIVISIHYLRGMALGPFLLCASGLPLVNCIGLKYAKVYMPVVPIIASGFAMFIGATFFSVAMYSYRRWRFIAAEAQAEQTADIKENFISLISHNLNTPIAQLKGLLDVLTSRVTDFSPSSKYYSSALLYLEYMRVTVRAVLKTSSMTQEPIYAKAATVRTFWEDFTESENAPFKRFGINLTAFPAEDNEEQGEIWFYRFTFDTEVYRGAFLYLLNLVHLKYLGQDIQIEFLPLNPEPADPKGLIIRLTWGTEKVVLPPDFTANFAIKAFSRYLDVAAEVRNIKYELSETSAQLILPDLYKPKEY